MTQSKWTTETLKEHFDALRASDKEALGAALVAVKEENRKTEVAAEKRFELLNELRSGVATKEQLEALEKIVEDLKTSRDTGTGRSSGLSQGWGILLGAVGLVGGIIAIFYAFK